MTQKGTHTWDMIIQYHCCPECGKILESREDFVYLKKQRLYQKNVVCDRCGNKFTVTKYSHVGYGPLLGDPQPPEIDWGSDN